MEKILFTRQTRKVQTMKAEKWTKKYAKKQKAFYVIRTTGISAPVPDIGGTLNTKTLIFLSFHFEWFNFQFSFSSQFHGIFIADITHTFNIRPFRETLQIFFSFLFFFKTKTKHRNDYKIEKSLNIVCLPCVVRCSMFKVRVKVFQSA